MQRPGSAYLFSLCEYHDVYAFNSVISFLEPLLTFIFMFKLKELTRGKVLIIYSIFKCP